MTTEQRQNKLKRVLFPVLGVILVIVAAAVVLIQYQMTRETPTHVFEEPDFHETADTTTPLVVNFVVPSTTAEEYDLLYSAISDQMRVNSTPEPQSPVVSVTEDTFIDREDDSDPYTSEEQEVYTEYDRAYFEDFLMVRYVSQSGVIHVVGARLGGEDGTEIELYDQSDFTSEHFSAVVVEKEGKENNWKFWERSGKELEEEIEAEMESSGAISEDTFVACIGQCTLELLTRAESWERILSHFTAEGMASLLRIVQVLEIGEECAVNLVLAEVGSTNHVLGTMDRMYLRCEVVDGGEPFYLNLLLKINANLLVYDVDLI